MDAARPGNREKNSGPAREIPVGGGRVAGGLLVVEGEESDAESDGAGGEGGDGYADDTEHLVDAEAGERLGGYGVAVQQGLGNGLRFRHKSRVFESEEEVFVEMRKREVFYIRRRVIVVGGVSIWGRWRRVEKEKEEANLEKGNSDIGE